MRTLPLLLLAACSHAPTPAAPVTGTPGSPVLERGVFNQRAVDLGLPVFQDADGTVVAYRTTVPFDGGVKAATAKVEAWDGRLLAGLSEDEAVRRHLVQQELAQGRVTLIETDLRGLGAADKAMVRHLLDAADDVEALYQRQIGVHDLWSQVPADDPTSRLMFWRDQGPWCVAAATREDPRCAAIPDAPPRRSGLYPTDLQADPDFCASLRAEHPDVLKPFVAAVRTDDGLVAVPYAKRWPAASGKVAADLKAAAAAAPEDEGPLRAYLSAAADAFVTNDWYAADAAWAKMSDRNSEWYLRVAPDETGADPCQEHASYQLSLARVNPDGVRLQDQLKPVKQDMEQAVAKLAGAPYTARTVGFDLPEFIDIVINAGDARSPLGGTIGESLPNWGPVAASGGRTVAMTNLGSDPDSVAATRRVLAATFCSDTMARWPSDPSYELYSTVLHEAGHNLGPSAEYAVDGKTDVEVFGGALAAMLEELKAQSIALYMTDWLAQRGVEPPERAVTTNVADLAWALGHIAGGMYDADGGTLPYAQLAAIQVGYLLDRGGLTWNPDTPAANGEDQGCLQVDPDALPGAIETLTGQVLHIKAAGDLEAAKALKARYVDDQGDDFAHFKDAVVQRFRREPRASYVYRVVLE